MGYLGNTPGENFITFSKQVFTIVNSQTAYTLDFAVVDENELRLVINNVVQEPGSGKAYTASGTTLTLASALTNGTDEMYCVFLGKARETVTVPTITKDKLNLISNATAGLTVKGDGGSNDGYIALNCSQNSHAVKIKAPPHSAGQSYTLTLPQSITNNTFLKTDGSGNLSFAAAGGRFTLVSTGTIAGGATYIDLDDVFTATYKNYLLVYTGVDVNTDGADLHIQVKTSSGLVSGGSDYVYGYGQIASNNNISSSYDTGNSYYRLNNSGVGNAATESASGTVLFYEPRSTSHYHLMEGHQVSLSTGVDALSNWSVGAAKTTTALTGLRFKAASGNLDAGVLKLYGAND